MIQVAVVAELMEGYTAAVARAMERLLSAAPPRVFPRRVRFLVLRRPPLRRARRRRRRRRTTLIKVGRRPAGTHDLNRV
ncbi:hypothetical protein GUJ93_ZPchr0007g5527 [Zizania palustris]|uniref:Uncharacterized protein n=1 Tax=Zizania palustris TaxID=103762 RepID=A0A8J5VPZ5_ZIZPA|nr:hypothetical protein GUJ93_ZPchr0007g5527 [Zizania palustris]